MCGDRTVDFYVAMQNISAVPCLYSALGILHLTVATWGGRVISLYIQCPSEVTSGSTLPDVTSGVHCRSVGHYF